MDDMSYEEYKKWLDMKTVLEESGKTDSPFYAVAVSKLFKRPVPPYPKATDGEPTKDKSI